jgi:hypothetical protein
MFYVVTNREAREGESGADSRNAVYLDFTRAKHVGKSHTYFSNRSLRNPNVLRVFKAILNGEQAEAISDAVTYDVHTRAYQVL